MCRRQGSAHEGVIMQNHARCIPCKYGHQTQPGVTDVCSVMGMKTRELKVCPKDVHLVADPEDMDEILRRARNGDEVAKLLLAGCRR